MTDEDPPYVVRRTRGGVVVECRCCFLRCEHGGAKVVIALHNLPCNEELRIYSYDEGRKDQEGLKTLRTRTEAGG